MACFACSSSLYVKHALGKDGSADPNCTFLTTNLATGSGESRQAQTLDRGASRSSIYSKCEIIYRGGPLIPVLAWSSQLHTVGFASNKEGAALTVNAENALKFTDCRFEFSIPQLPPPLGQQLTQFMLAQNKPAVELPISRQAAR